MTKALLVDERKKKCPVCGAVTFENARLCYGCMHRFIDDTLTDAFTDAFADVCSAQPPRYLRKSVANYAAL